MYIGEFNEALSTVVSFTRRRPDEISFILKRAFDALMDKDYDRANGALKEATVKCYQIIWSLQHRAVMSAYNKISRKFQNKISDPFCDQDEKAKDTMRALKLKYEDFQWSVKQSNYEGPDIIERRKRQVAAGFEIMEMAGKGIESVEIFIYKREKRNNRIKRIILALMSAIGVSVIVYVATGAII